VQPEKEDDVRRFSTEQSPAMFLAELASPLPVRKYVRKARAVMLCWVLLLNIDAVIVSPD
jgi:hypothetical protein